MFAFLQNIDTYEDICTFKIPPTEEPDRLQSTGPQRGGHDCTTKHKRSGREER